MDVVLDLLSVRIPNHRYFGIKKVNDFIPCPLISL